MSKETIEKAINKMIIDGEPMSLSDFKGKPEFTKALIIRINNILFNCKNTLEDLRLIK